MMDIYYIIVRRPWKIKYDKLNKPHISRWVPRKYGHLDYTYMYSLKVPHLLVVI